MPIIGCITEFFIAEILQWIEKGKKTGLLTVRALPESQGTPLVIHYIWVYQGRIVAAANRLDNQGLVELIAQQNWLSERVLTKLSQCCCPSDKPLGLCLKKHCALEIQQLKQLFQIQLLQQVLPLFQLIEAQFKFDLNAPIPGREMTGLSVKASKATLMELRVLTYWEVPVEQFPDPNKGFLLNIIADRLLQRDALEWLVGKYTNGTVSLKAIAQQLIPFHFKLATDG